MTTPLQQRSGDMTAKEVVQAAYLQTGNELPLVMRPAVEGADLRVWAEANRKLIEEETLKHGAILFRDFNIKLAPEEFKQFIQVTAGELLEYKERSSPRSAVSGNVYTSTDYPASKNIALHNENSYQNYWPLKIFFFCTVAAQRGGETPLADCRKVFARISPETRERFIKKGWMYVRNFGSGFGLPWQTVFQTTDRDVVNQHCHEQGIEVEWKEGNQLRTRAVRPAVIAHPLTGEMVWFNHAAFFHISSIEPGIREALLEEFDEGNLPATTYYGDGSPIEPEVLDELRKAYRQESVAFPWQEGDILLVDNMLTAHGRAPYSGPRKVLVGMAQLIKRRDVE
jgi:alpha-ketoglutarate-dependent taurine dioxygenase